MILGKQCLCCKYCSECKELKKVITDTGFDIYLYVKNPQESTNKYDLLECQGFVLKNTHNFKITSNDFLGIIESKGLKCQRCKTILQHIGNALKGQSVERNEIFIICDCCTGKAPNYGVKCRQCYKIYNKLASDEKIQDDFTNVTPDSWVSKIRHLLNSTRETESNVTSLETKKDVYSQQPLPQSHIRTKSQPKSIKDILQSIKYFQNVSSVKMDSHKISPDLAYVSHAILPQQVQVKSSPESITDNLKKVPEEAFKYVFPTLEIDSKDLKEYVSSSELIKDIKDKMQLLRGRKKEVLEKKTSIRMKKSKSAETAQEKKEIKPEAMENELITKDQKIEKESVIDKSKPTKQEKTKNLKQIKKDNVVEVDKSKKESKRVKDVTTKKLDKIPQSIQSSPKVKKTTEEISKNKTVNDSLIKAIEEAKNELKAQKKPEKSAKSPPFKFMNLSGIKVRKASLDEEHIGMIKIKPKGEPDKKLPQLPDITLPPIQRHQADITSEESDLDELNKSFLKKKPVEDNEIIIGQKIFKLKTPFMDKMFKKFSKNKEVQPLLFNSTFNDNDFVDTQPIEVTDNRTSLLMKQRRSPSLKPATYTAYGHSRDAANNSNFRDRDREKIYAPTESISFSRIKIRKPSIDGDHHIGMVKIKQSVITENGKRLTQLADQNILQQSLQRQKTNLISDDSESQITVDELLQRNRFCENSDVIVGEKILKSKTPFSSALNANEATQPFFFETTFTESNSDILKLQVNDQMPPIIESTYPAAQEEVSLFSNHFKHKKCKTNQSDQEAKGTVRYALSNRSFIDKGWTMLPTEKIVRKMNVYRMRPSHPEFDWFEHNKSKKQMHYDSGEALAEFQPDGRGRLYYKNGRIALDYYDAEETNAGQRYVVYSNGEPDEKGRARPVTVLATFDFLGNGIVLDHTGKVRLKYNQTEGVVLDREIGPVSHWKWHELNDPPVLQKVMIDTQMAVKDPEILKLGGGGNTPRMDNEEMLAIEFDNFIKEKSKKLSQKFKPFQIKMKAMKINENFSLKVLDQASVYLLFREGTTNIKLNLGMILDHKEIVDTDTAELGEVTCNLERFPARTDSLATLQRSVAHAQRLEKLRMDHERRIKVPEEIPSVDRLKAAISRPLRSTVRNLPEPKCNCKVKPPPCS